MNTNFDIFQLPIIPDIPGISFKSNKDITFRLSLNKLKKAGDAPLLLFPFSSPVPPRTLAESVPSVLQAAFPLSLLQFSVSRVLLLLFVSFLQSKKLNQIIILMIFNY